MKNFKIITLDQKILLLIKSFCSKNKKKHNNEMVQLLERELNNSSYQNQSQAFLIKKKTFDRQYAPLYAERLLTMRSDIENTALKKWGTKYEIKKNLVDLVQNTKSIIIGTLFQEMKNKPNILKELADDENNLIPVQVILTFLNGEFLNNISLLCTFL